VPNSILYRIASGDKTAVKDCLKTYGGLVWSLAKRMLPNQDDAEDAVQEIFIDVWKNAGRFDEKQSSETTFVAMLARRRLIDRLRKSNRQPNFDSLEDVTFEPAKRADLDIHTSIEAKEAAAAVRDLRPEQQQVLFLSICQGLSHQEIANLTGMPIGTVKTHARRGLIEVRETLLKNFGKLNETKEVSA
jgi:RNA polymerase sigma-70 factor (ECF subfamily)